VFFPSSQPETGPANRAIITPAKPASIATISAPLGVGQARRRAVSRRRSRGCRAGTHRVAGGALAAGEDATTL